MFSGIVETIGIITQAIEAEGCRHLTIRPKHSFTDIQIGDSIAVNGVCLTATQITPQEFQVTVVPETLRLTNLQAVTIGEAVNLERSLALGSRVSGHQVQGHVDGMGKIIDITTDHSQALLVKIAIPASLAKYIVNKGYITLNGMSITVITCHENEVTVTFIPHTQAVTTTHLFKLGDLINIEVDIIGKYVEKLIGAYTHANTH